MQTLVKPCVPNLVREYWGYITEWKEGKLEPFQFIKPVENIFKRTVFPFPHQPSIRKEFYKHRMIDYIAFMQVARQASAILLPSYKFSLIKST